MRGRTIAWLALAAVACGGASGPSLLDPSDAGTGEPDSSVTPPDASSQPDASPPEDGGATDGAVADAAPPEDANKYQDPGVACGQTDCDPSTSLCCRTVTTYYPQITYGYACEPLSDLVKCAAGTSIYCDDDQDCDGGQVCCGDLGYNSGYAKVSCKETCSGVVLGYTQIHFCDPNAPDCDVNQTCGASQAAPGYFVCQ